MKAPLKILAAAVCGLLLGLPAAQAGDLPIHEFINIGTAGNELAVHPHALQLNVGETYQFVVSNPSQQIHVVAAPELAATATTVDLMILGQKLGVDAPSLDISTGITLQPGQMILWTFTPLGEGVYKFGCDDPVHSAAGMHTMVEVSTQEVL